MKLLKGNRKRSSWPWGKKKIFPHFKDIIFPFCFRNVSAFWKKSKPFILRVRSEVILGSRGSCNLRGAWMKGGGAFPGWSSPRCVPFMKSHRAPCWLYMHSSVLCYASKKTFTWKESIGILSIPKKPKKPPPKQKTNKPECCKLCVLRSEAFCTFMEVVAIHFSDNEEFYSLFSNYRI